VNVRKSIGAPQGTLRGRRHRVDLVRIVLESDKCQGHNRCYALAPELFDVDDYGQSVLLVDGDIPAELVDKARLAAANCPEFAIKIVEN
jgi:ferredoxin